MQRLCGLDSVGHDYGIDVEHELGQRIVDPSERISQLKIDRSVPATAGRSWVVPGAALAILGVAVVWFKVSGLFALSNEEFRLSDSLEESEDMKTSLKSFPSGTNLWRL